MIMIMMVMIMSQMMMMKLSVCCGLVAQYEVHNKCCQSHSVQPSPNVWLVVVMMVVMMMAMNVYDDDDEAECLLWTCSTE